MMTWQMPCRLVRPYLYFPDVVPIKSVKVEDHLINSVLKVAQLFTCENKDGYPIQQSEKTV